MGLSSSVSDVPEGEDEHFMEMNDMVFDVLRQHATFESSNLNNMDEPPNEEDRRFYNLLLEANKPLFEGATNSKLSIYVRLLAC